MSRNNQEISITQLKTTPFYEHCRQKMVAHIILAPFFIVLSWFVAYAFNHLLVPRWLIILFVLFMGVWNFLYVFFVASEAYIIKHFDMFIKSKKLIKVKFDDYEKSKNKNEEGYHFFLDIIVDGKPMRITTKDFLVHEEANDTYSFLDLKDQWILGYYSKIKHRVNIVRVLMKSEEDKYD
ncbi:MAG: hypothetical protein HUJ61_06860 [Bacilli bacterium]|nr:hypothetical protein [Bacilli bacterium]